MIKGLRLPVARFRNYKIGICDHCKSHMWRSKNVLKTSVKTTIGLVNMRGGVIYKITRERGGGKVEERKKP